MTARHYINSQNSLISFGDGDFYEKFFLICTPAWKLDNPYCHTAFAQSAIMAAKNIHKIWDSPESERERIHHRHNICSKSTVHSFQRSTFFFRLLKNFIKIFIRHNINKLVEFRRRSTKGGLIWESFSLWLKSPKKSAESLFCRNLLNRRF